eukprot:1040110-Pelagomonas_calceolata.AAC.1
MTLMNTKNVQVFRAAGGSVAPIGVASGQVNQRVNASPVLHQGPAPVHMPAQEPPRNHRVVTRA